MIGRYHNKIQMTHFPELYVKVIKILMVDFTCSTNTAVLYKLPW